MLLILFTALSISLKKLLKPTEFETLAKKAPTIKKQLKQYFDLCNDYATSDNDALTTLIPFTTQVTHHTQILHCISV